MKRHGSMNHIFRLVWSQVTNTWVAVAETTRGRGKGSKRKLVAAALALNASFALASPEGGHVVSGTGIISQSGAVTNITQSTRNLSLNWNGFNVASHETVNFLQPNAAAVAVNRIFDVNGSQILGRINANGQVYLINPNGILFGRGAQVNVGGLVASTLDLTDSTLGTDVRSFRGSGTGSLINQGTINAVNGGYVALLGNHVGNEGIITAKLGTVALGGGSAATLTFSGNSLVKMQIDQSTLNNLAENGGLVKADGGVVMMTAGARDSLLASIVNNTGVIEAQTVENKNGTITLIGSMSAGTVHVAGTLDASAPIGGNGGFIETSAAHVKVVDAAKVTTAAAMGLNGTWLIDPVDFTIAATGGDITGAALSAKLATTPITIDSITGTVNTTTGQGDVNVNDAVSWSANTLTLNAQRNININANLNATATASLALAYGQGAVAAGNTAKIITTSGATVSLPAGTANFTTKQGSDGGVKNYTVITALGAPGSTTAADLQGINGGLGNNYALGANIDASATNGLSFRGSFTPIGTAATQFSGIFQGLGHTISNLTVNSLSTDLGLFGNTATSAVIQNIGLVGEVINGGTTSGGLVGSNNGLISNSFAKGVVKPPINSGAGTGGLVGKNSGTIENSFSSSDVNAGAGGGGGLIGYNLGGVVTNSYATGNVSGDNYIGGLVGEATGGCQRRTRQSHARIFRNSSGRFPDTRD